MYCDYRDQHNQSISNIIGSFAKQLVSQARSIPVAVWEIYNEKAGQHEMINLESAEAIFEHTIQCFDHVYICIDALDECQPEPRRQLLYFLKRLTGTTLRLFMTGRPSVEDEIISTLRDIAISRIPIVAKEEDIRLCLSEKFDHDPYPEAMDDLLKMDIQNKIVQQSQGM